jgi:O-antigen/teichoic acid export membrane protein
MSTRRALSLSFVDRYGALVISVLSSMAIARLLTPTEIGVYSVTMVLVSLTMSLRDLGSGHYLVQERELTPARLRATWTVQLLVGLAFGLVLAAAAWPVSQFYGDARIVDIMLVIALNFAVNPFGSMTYAWLMREMRFDRLAVMRLSAALAGALASVWLAWRGLGPISLALGSLVATLTNALVAIRFRPAHFPWLPGRGELRRVLSFGGKLSASTVIRTLGEGAPELLLGKLQSLTAAGLYSRAGGLTQMFNRLLLDAVSVVAQPLFARVHREAGDVGETFLKALSYVTVLGWGFFTGMGLLAHPLVRLLYGEQWDGAVGAVRLLSLAAAFAVPAALCPIALMVTGGINRALRITVIAAVNTLLAAAAGSPFGLLGVAAALVIAQGVNTVWWLNATLKHLRIRKRSLVRAMTPSVAVACTTAAVPVGIVLTMGWQATHTATAIGLALVGGVPLFVLALRLWQHPMFGEVRLLMDSLRARLHSS